MTSWIDLLVYTALIVAVWFALPTWSARLTLAIATDRNPAWATAHPESTTKLGWSHRFLWLCYFWGVLSVACLVALQSGALERIFSTSLLGAEQWERLKALNSLLLAVGLVGFGGGQVALARRLKRVVPLAERRQASLERRSIDDFISRPVRIAAYTLVGLQAAAWLVVGLGGDHDGARIWSGFASLIVFSTIFFSLTRLSVARSPMALDRILGASYRRAEVRSAFVVEICVAVMFALRLYGEVGEAPFEIERLNHLALAILVTAGLLAFTRNLTTKPASRDSLGSSGLVAFVLTLTLVTAASPQARAAPSDEDIRKILVERVETHRQSIGMVVGVVDPSGARVIAYGARARGDLRPLDGDTVFELASVTKVFTGFLLADAVRRGEVALDDPVAKYLPPDVKMPERGGRQITLLDLATHTSGLPREPSNLDPKDPLNPFADYTVAQLYAFLSGYQLSRDIGVQFEYSNLGAGLLGHVLARRAGTDYETLIRTRITGPLGMRDTAMVMTPGMQARLALGHNQALAPTPNWDTPTLAGAGALRSTVNDMNKFLGAALGLSGSSLDQTFAALAATRRQIQSPQPRPVVAGWGVGRLEGAEILFGAGRSGGYRSWIGYDAQGRTGVVILTNTDSSTEPDDIGLHLLRASFPLRTAFTQWTPRTEVEVDPAVFQRYVGRYQFAPGVTLTATRLGDRFFGQITGQPAFQLFAESESKFFMRAADAQLTFEADGVGKVMSVVLHQNGFNQRAMRAD